MKSLSVKFGRIFNLCSLAPPCSSSLMLPLYTSPPPVYQVQGEVEALYVQWLFALRERGVEVVECSSAWMLMDAFTFLQERWVELVEDVELGRIKPDLVLDAGIRSALERWLKPDPHRAAELRVELEAGFGGVALRLWPGLRLIQTLTSASNQIHRDALKQQHCRGVHFYCPLYCSSEGLMGVNLWPLQGEQHFLLSPRSVFFEFFPEEPSEEAHTLLMEELKKEQKYQLIITNGSGRYRYRTGEVVKVVGFYGRAPVVEPLYRQDQMLSVRGEGVSEDLFFGALQTAVTQWPGVRLLDYCCADSGILGDSSGGAQPHYLVFLELTGIRNLTEEQRYKLDVCLQSDCSVYRLFRIKGSIGPMRVQLVGGGTFRELRRLMSSSSNVSSSRFQVHRVIYRKEYVDFLLRKSVS